MSSPTKSKQADVSIVDRPWSIQRPELDAPERIHFLQNGALLLVVTDDRRREWSARTRRVAIGLAATSGARILFYDRSAESRLVNAYASGPLTADSEWSGGERMLDPEELYLLGRAYLANDVEKAAAAGVRAWGWLPRSTGRRGIAEAVRRFGVDLIVVPAELRASLREPAGRRWPWQAKPLETPILVASADGSLREWQLAAELSRVEFAARQFGFLVVRGRFSDFEVRLEFDEACPEATKVEARIATASLTTGLGIRDRDLRGPSFFDVERYPYMRFGSTRVTRDGTSYRILGELEIKDRRREVELIGEFRGVAAERGYRRATMSAHAALDRRDWDLTGGPKIADSVSLSIDAVAVRASRPRLDPET